MLVLYGACLFLCSFLLSTASPSNSWREDLFLYGMFIGALLTLVGLGWTLLGIFS